MGDEEKLLAVEELLERNNISKNRFLGETYECMLMSIFETIASEMANSDTKKEIKKRYLSSADKVITTQKLVYEKTRCNLSYEESEKIYKYLCAYFAKRNVRENYDNSVRQKLLENQNGKCNICDCRIDIFCAELDHIVPWTLVGDELGVKNLQMLCRDCNRRKSKNSAYNLKMFLVKKPTS